MPVILAPPGSGKTTWVAQNPHWHDMDVLYCPQYHSLTWSKQPHSEKAFQEHYMRIDKVVERDRASKNIIGSLFYKLIPDAIVLIHEPTHKRYVAQRTGTEVLNWSDANHVRQVLLDVSQKHNVKVFSSFDHAAAYVA
tara:strand:- start:22 stop:435 length:414 start_codon:yes stop_codon:yes gene_type:complete